MNKQMTINVKVQGLEHLRETVARLKELKELGAGNPDTMIEYLSCGSVIPKVIVEVEEEKPWYPNDMPWTEHDGKSIPKGNRFYILLKGERETKKYGGGTFSVENWEREFLWQGWHRNNIVAYIKG